MRNLKVIDLSHYNIVSDVHAVQASGIVGVIHKASEGTGWADPMFASRRQAFDRVGWASYHFLKPRNAAAQMQHYLSCAKPALGERVIIDYEDTNCSLADLNEAVNWLRQHAPENPIAIYGGSLLEEHVAGRAIMWLEGTSLWTAEYTTRDTPRWPTGTWPKWDLWQYSDGNAGGIPHEVSGVNKCDCSEFNGSDDECRAWFNAKTGPRSSASPAKAKRTVFRRGMEGGDVRLMQDDLRRAGQKIRTDGIFGPATEKAVMAFQTKYGLVPDGEVGPLTRRAIQASIQGK